MVSSGTYVYTCCEFNIINYTVLMIQQLINQPGLENPARVSPTMLQGLVSQYALGFAIIIQQRHIEG